MTGLVNPVHQYLEASDLTTCPKIRTQRFELLTVLNLKFTEGGWKLNLGVRDFSEMFLFPWSCSVKSIPGAGGLE